MTIYFKPCRYFGRAIDERLRLDFGMSLEKYLSLYKDSPANREVMKELASIFFRLPVGDITFKVESEMLESELLPLTMSVLYCPGFFDKDTEEILKGRILFQRNKTIPLKEMVVEANQAYPNMSYATYADLFRYLVVKLPIYHAAKLPRRIKSEELPDFLELIGSKALLKRYNIQELFLAFILLGYPVYANAKGGWNVGFQLLGGRTLANVFASEKFVGRARIDEFNNFDTTEV